MTKPLESLKDVISRSVLMLVDLKSVILSYQNAEVNKWIKTSVSDIDECIAHGNEYISDISRYDYMSFKFYRDLVNLVDTIIDNDFGIVLSEKQESEKSRLCNNIITIIDEMIMINNNMKKIQER